MKKVMFYICATLFLFSGMIVVASVYLTRVGFLSGFSATAIIALEIIGTVCFGYTTLRFEDIVSEGK